MSESVSFVCRHSKDSVSPTGLNVSVQSSPHSPLVIEDRCVKLQLDSNAARGILVCFLDPTDGEIQIFSLCTIPCPAYRFPAADGHYLVPRWAALIAHEFVISFDNSCILS